VLFTSCKMMLILANVTLKCSHYICVMLAKYYTLEVLQLNPR